MTEATVRFERAGLLELAQELVRIPSHPGLRRQEEGVARALAGYLAAHAVPAELAEAAPGRPNLSARVEGAAPGRTLLLCGHTDTVPLNAGDAGFGFSGDVVDGWLRGRGAVDMKGPLAAMAAALVVAHEDAVLPAGALVLAAVADEEMESLGAEALVRSRVRADGALVGEPTSNRLALGHKGLEWLVVELAGRAAHGGTPAAGVSAIDAAAHVLSLVEERLEPRLARRVHPLLGAPTINAGTIHGGDQPSTVAARCAIQFDRRTVPGETYEQVVAELAELAREVEARRPGLAITLARMPGGMATLEHLPLEIAADHPLAAAAALAVAAVSGRASAPLAFPAWTDGALLSGFGGIPTAVLGPGDLALAHSPVEALPVAELYEAAAIYLECARRFCGGSVG